MDYIVTGRPEICLDMIRGYFESEEWPYKDAELFGPDITGKEVTAAIPRLPRYATNIGCALLIGSVITVGLLLPVWLLWVLFFQEETYPKITVRAISADPHATRITLKCNRPEYAAPLRAWIQRELVEKEAAAPNSSGN